MTTLPPLAIPDLAIYVHWPYCARICPYCDFNVHLAGKREGEARTLVDAMVRDLERQREVTGVRAVTSVHFGGGTPSLMEAGQVTALVGAVDRLWGLPKAAEVGLEANPSFMDAARVKGFRDAGVNRLSFGVQTFHDRGLALLGRDHSGAEAREAVEGALEVMGNVSCDLIFGWRGETVEEWESDLATAVGLGAPHVSAYQLTVEPGTAFARAEARGARRAEGEEAMDVFYRMAEDMLGAAGLDHYEVSNWARPGFASAHNSAYWRGVDYVGAGPGAHGRITVDGARVATVQARRPADYIADPVPEVEALSAEDAALERLLMGLRIREGVPLAELGPLELPGLDAMVRQGMVVTEGGRLAATPDGRRVLDGVIRELLG